MKWKDNNDDRDSISPKPMHCQAKRQYSAACIHPHHGRRQHLNPFCQYWVQPCWHLSQYSTPSYWRPPQSHSTLLYDTQLAALRRSEIQRVQSHQKLATSFDNSGHTTTIPHFFRCIVAPSKTAEISEYHKQITLKTLRKSELIPGRNEGLELTSINCECWWHL